MSTKTINNPEFRIHPVTLRFLGGQEDAFQEDYIQKSLVQIRISLALGLILYPLFGILDYLLIPNVKEKIWFIRFVIVCPYLLLLFLFTFTRSFKRISQPLLILTTLVMGFGIIAMTVIGYPPGSYFYYAGLILVLMWTYTSAGLRFLNATFAGWALVVGYEILAIGFEGTPFSVLINNNFFFLSANIIGMLACYLIEFYKRRDFCQRRWLEEERQKSEVLLLKLHHELALASDVQKSLLPPPTLNWQGGELMCFSQPSIEIGGDFYSYHAFEDGRFALALGDVAGHGIPAALFMATCLSLYSASLSQRLNPGERLARLDDELEPYTERNHQNCAFCYLEINRGVLFIANAGGIPPYIHKASGIVERLKVCGIPLGHGLGKYYGYQSKQYELCAGDSVILVSDGVVEAIGKSGEMFGFERLRQTIAAGPNGTPRAMLDHLVREVNVFSDEGAIQDDITIAILRPKLEKSKESEGMV